MRKKIIEEIKSHKFVYLLLSLILFGSFFIRTLNINNLLGFYYDQGRDALTIWDLWHGGNIPFIGPTTGIAGIFRGPFYYYLIAPFYLIGRGNPVFPSVFLSFTSVLAVLLMYYLGFKIQNRIAGLIAATLSAFSFNIVLASRWLSNPTPMLLLSLLFIWMLILITEGKILAWIPAVFIATISLFHFGSAGEVFYFFSLLILAISEFKKRRPPSKKIVIWSLALFLFAILPLVAFDIKNKGLIVANIQKFLVTDKSFKLPSWKFVSDKLSFYYDVFTDKIFDARSYLEKTLLSTILLLFFYHLRDLFKKDGVKILILVLGSVMLGLIFFQGNFGNFYDYYLTGYYLPFLLLLAVFLGFCWRKTWGKLLIIYFIYLFFIRNVAILKPRFTDGGLGRTTISFRAQKEAIDWIYKDALDQKFNVDVYVPPVIPYSYDYLFKWLGAVKYGREPDKKITQNLYLLYEHDPDHQDRLDAWMKRQNGISKLIKQEKFGAITVERRIRIQ